MEPSATSRHPARMSFRAGLLFGIKSLPDQPSNGLRAGWLIGLRAAPRINGRFEMRAQSESQDRILTDRGSPALFS